MKPILQDRLQSQVSEELPGFVVTCEVTSANAIDIDISNPVTHELIRITGVTLESLCGPGALDAMVDQLMFEIVTIAVPTSDRTPSDQEEDRRGS